mgnify:CR=1 FL=1
MNAGRYTVAAFTVVACVATAHAQNFPAKPLRLRSEEHTSELQSH